MTDPNLVSLSFSAFLAVLVVLSLLALAIRALALVFHERVPAPVAPSLEPAASASTAGDPALVAALHAVIAQQRPGARIARIDETTPRSAP